MLINFGRQGGDRCGRGAFTECRRWGPDPSRFVMLGSAIFPFVFPLRHRGGFLSESFRNQDRPPHPHGRDGGQRGRGHASQTGSRACGVIGQPRSSARPKDLLFLLPGGDAQKSTSGSGKVHARCPLSSLSSVLSSGRIIAPRRERGESYSTLACGLSASGRVLTCMVLSLVSLRAQGTS